MPTLPGPLPRQAQGPLKAPRRRERVKIKIGARAKLSEGEGEAVEVHSLVPFHRIQRSFEREAIT